MCQRSTRSGRRIFVDILKRYIGRKIPNFIACQDVEKWQWLTVSMWHLIEISDAIVVYAYRKASNFKLEESRCFYGNSLRFSEEYVVKFSDKFFHFQDATREMCKGALNNYSMLKLSFFNQHPHFCNVKCKKVSHQYYVPNQDTKPHILS